MWIVTHAKDQLGLDIDRFILTGDSAGGCLCFTVSNLSILRGFQRPDAIFAYYANVELRTKFYPSNLLGIDDYFLSKFLMEMFEACYFYKTQPADHYSSPLLSPLYAPDAMLKHLPPIEFIVAENDQLRDP